MERRRRAPIGGKLSRAGSVNLCTPPPFPQPPSSLCTFLASIVKRAGTCQARPNRTSGAMRLLPLLRTVLWAAFLGSPLRGGSSVRHVVYWNSSNPRLLRGDAVVELGLNDYLDIVCPHYEGPGPPEGPETFALYMVDWPGYESCQAEGPRAFKRWVCSLPFGHVQFSEKIQRFTPFSLGFEFLPGETYYYISVPTPESSGQCLRLQVSVCCKERKSESAHPVGSPGESGTSGWRRGDTPSPLCLLLLLLLLILRLLRIL
ncbi:ephrin-A4 isoform X1 [Chlorocebus sabaeus]|uniref:ephrin-A4 isoform X1 n=1 Tax=Chlorocebus sabaeus TaxID=60711 RepID=UPI00045DD36A